MSKREDFSERTKRILARRVGYICSNPDCRVATSGPHTSADKAIIVGVAAHITAASPGGPRYDMALSSEQRKSPENGIWLCQNCAKLIDSDPVLFSERVLLNWKSQAENEQFLEISQLMPNQRRPTTVDDMIALLKTLMKHSKAEAGFHVVFDPIVQAVSGTVGFQLHRIRFDENIKIFDILGGITNNRIMLTLKSDGAIELTVLDRHGNSSSISFFPKPSKLASIVFVTWEQNEFSLWWTGKKVICLKTIEPISGKWFMLASGIDIDGDANASFLVFRARGGGILGMGLCASNKALQVIMCNVAFWNTVLSGSEILDLAEAHKVDVNRSL